MKITKNNGEVSKRRGEEQLMEQVEKQQATIDYVAMMADVDLPEEMEREVKTDGE